MRQQHAWRASVAFVAALICVTAPAVAGAAAPPQEPPGSAVAKAVDKQIRIIQKDGTKQTGRLVSLSSSTVVIRQKAGESSFTLDRVRKVERVAHHVRTGFLLGLAFTGGMALMALASEGDCADCEDAYGMAALFSVIALGAGPAVGGIYHGLTADSRVLYQAPKPSPASGVRPRPSSRGAAMTVKFRW